MWTTDEICEPLVDNRIRGIGALTVGTMTALDQTGAPPVDLLRLADVLSSMPSGTVLSHRTAAQIWGIWIPNFSGIEVTTPATARGSSYTTSVQRQTVIAHRRIVPAEDVRSWHGLPSLSPARTWLDLAPLLDLPDLIAAGDSALRAGASVEEITARATAARGLRGVVKIRRAAPLLNARSRSRPESRIRAGIVLAGLPEPKVNVAVHDAFGQWLAEPDLHYELAKLALEYNGADHATTKRMGKDATRLLCLQRDDWTVRTYTAVDAFHRLDQVAADVQGLLSRLAPSLLIGTRLGSRVTTWPRR